MAEPTLQQLRYGVAVADHRHFGRAAAACHVSQPALSAQVRELESRLSVTLFERAPGRVVITPAGADLLDRARAILLASDDLQAAAHAAVDPLASTLRLGIIPTVAPYLLPRAMPGVRAAFPDLDLYLREDRTDVLVAQLLAGHLDLILLALPLHRPELQEHHLFDDPFVLALSERHPLAGTDRVSPAVVVDERLVLLEEGHCLRDQALEVCSLAGREGAAQIQGTSLGTVVQMVASGLGVTLLPELAVDQETRRGSGVAVVPFRDPPPSRSIGLAWRSTAPRTTTAAYRRLGDVLVTPVAGGLSTRVGGK